jgi:glycine/D-amino acid oxidase-like deaminating enzyme/nitrite reductase/ring-hydroxylating ferredoxin subunit
VAALVERGHGGQGETGHTTAHLSAVTDRPFSELVRTLGEDHAAAVWDAGLAAIAEIESIVQVEDIDCDFRWAAGYLHASLDDGSGDERERLKAEAALVARAGFDAFYLESIPGLARPGVEFDRQAKLHPLRYLQALLKRIPGAGSYVFEGSPVEEVQHDDPLSVTIGAHRISASFVVIATHVPLVGKASLLSASLLQSDLYPYSTYAVAATIEKGLLPEAMFWDTTEPYYYLRVDAHQDDDRVIAGGADHKTGQAADTREHFARIEAKLRQLLPRAHVTHHWSGQVIETRDGLPYIGETSPHQYAITGFSGNGLTFGTVGAMMARDAFAGRRSPWRDLFDSGRTLVTRGLWDYLSENKDYPYYKIRDRFAGSEGKSLRDLKRGEGKILELKGEKIAACRGDDGRVSKVSAVCTHMGCLVVWNQAESTWDCPCHGSRFTAAGAVIGGPAESPLPESEPRQRVTLPRARAGS